MEKYLYRSVASYGFSWLSRPAVIVYCFWLQDLFCFHRARQAKGQPGNFVSVFRRGDGEGSR